jgi:hypothetical protein
MNIKQNTTTQTARVIKPRSQPARNHTAAVEITEIELASSIDQRAIRTGVRGGQGGQSP